MTAALSFEPTQEPAHPPKVIFSQTLRPGWPKKPQTHNYHHHHHHQANSMPSPPSHLSIRPAPKAQLIRSTPSFNPCCPKNTPGSRIFLSQFGPYSFRFQHQDSVPSFRYQSGIHRHRFQAGLCTVSSKTNETLPSR